MLTSSKSHYSVTKVSKTTSRVNAVTNVSKTTSHVNAVTNVSKTTGLVNVVTKVSNTTDAIERKITARRQRSRDRLRDKENNNIDSIKSTRLDDILNPPPPPPPARTDTRNIKEILASHRSRPRRPFNDTHTENGIRSPPTSPPPFKSEPAPAVKSEHAPTVRSEPAPKSPASAKRPTTPKSPLRSEGEDEAEDILERLRKRKDQRKLTNKPSCCSHDRCKQESDNPDKGPRLHTWPCLLSRYSGPDPKTDTTAPVTPPKAEPEPTPPTPKTPMSPPSELERQALDSLESMTSDLMKERDEARKERNESREKCSSILTDYDGRRQVWQNQLNVVKIRLEHYARRHDKLRNDIVKQREQFDVERSRMKERHANQIEGLFGDLFSKIKSDNKYVGSQTGLDEVNYKLQAFMELWKGLAHDVDDLYDKEHYCLRLCETVKSLEEQIKHQNKIISGLVKGQPPQDFPAPPLTPDLPPPNINVTIDEHKWEIIVPPNKHAARPKHLPKFEEIEVLDSLLPAEDGLSCEDILRQFAPIEETLNSVSLSLGRNKKREYHRVTSPPPVRATSPRAMSPPIVIQVRDKPVVKSEPLPKPSIDIHRTIANHNTKPELPIQMDPKAIRNAKINQPRAVPAEPIKPFSSPQLFEEPFKQTPMETTFDEPAAPKETLIDDPAPKKKKKKKPKAKQEEPPPASLETTFDEPAVEPVIVPHVQSLRRSSPSPTPSFRRRRASMESAKDFSVLDGYPGDMPLSPPLMPRTPKETTLDDPAARVPPPQAYAPAPPPVTSEPPPADKKKKKWTPSMPIFSRKSKPEPEDVPEPAPVQPQEKSTTATSSEAKTDLSDEPAPAPTRQMKRAKSLPRIRDPSLPRNMASANMKRAMSNPRLRHKQGPGSEYNSDDSDSDSDIRSLIESVYMPLHLTPSRASSRKNVADDAKSECSSFARRNKMPASMGWLDTNKGDSSDEETESSDEESSSEEDDDEDSDEEGSDEGEEGEGEEEGEEEDNESVASSGKKSSLGDIPVPSPLPVDEECGRNSMLSSIMKDFDNDSKEWLNSSFSSSQRGDEILI